MGSTILDYLSALGAFAYALGTNWWTIIGITMAIVQRTGRADGWWEKKKLPGLQAVKFVKRVSKALRFPVIVGGCFLIASFLAWNAENSANKSSANTIATDNSVLTSQRGIIDKQNEMLHQNHAASPLVERSITQNQKQDIAKALRGTGGGRIFFERDTAATDAPELIDQLAVALAQGGLNVNIRPSPITGDNARGIWVYGKPISKDSSALRAALLHTGFPIHSGQPPQPAMMMTGGGAPIEDDSLVIYVGRRE